MPRRIAASHRQRAAAAGSAYGFKDIRAVFAAAPDDANAATIVQRAVNATAIATWALLHSCLPQRIVLGGGIGQEHFDRFAAAMQGQIAHATQVPKTGIEIVMVGAAGLLFPPATTQ